MQSSSYEVVSKLSEEAWVQSSEMKGVESGVLLSEEDNAESLSPTALAQGIEADVEDSGRSDSRKNRRLSKTKYGLRNYPSRSLSNKASAGSRPQSDDLLTTSDNGLKSSRKTQEFRYVSPERCLLLQQERCALLRRTLSESPQKDVEIGIERNCSKSNPIVFPKTDRIYATKDHIFNRSVPVSKDRVMEINNESKQASKSRTDDHDGADKQGFGGEFETHDLGSLDISKLNQMNNEFLAANMKNLSNLNNDFLRDIVLGNIDVFGNIDIVPPNRQAKIDAFINQTIEAERREKEEKERQNEQTIWDKLEILKNGIVGKMGVDATKDTKRHDVLSNDEKTIGLGEIRSEVQADSSRDHENESSRDHENNNESTQEKNDSTKSTQEKKDFTKEKDGEIGSGSLSQDSTSEVHQTIWNVFPFLKDVFQDSRDKQPDHSAINQHHVNMSPMNKGPLSMNAYGQIFLNDTLNSNSASRRPSDTPEFENTFTYNRFPMVLSPIVSVGDNMLQSPAGGILSVSKSESGGMLSVMSESALHATNNPFGSSHDGVSPTNSLTVSNNRRPSGEQRSVEQLFVGNSRMASGENGTYVSTPTNSRGFHQCGHCSETIGCNAIVEEMVDCSVPFFLQKHVKKTFAEMILADLSRNIIMDSLLSGQHGSPLKNGLSPQKSRAQSAQSVGSAETRDGTKYSETTATETKYNGTKSMETKYSGTAVKQEGGLGILNSQERRSSPPISPLTPMVVSR